MLTTTKHARVQVFERQFDCKLEPVEENDGYTRYVTADLIKPLPFHVIVEFSPDYSNAWVCPYPQYARHSEPADELSRTARADWESYQWLIYWN